MRVAELDKRIIDAAVSRMVTGAGEVPSYRNDQIDVDLSAREIYSYGRHFPLYRYLPRRYRANISGDWTTVDRRSPALFVINGDRWRGGGSGWHRSRTPQHQFDTRAAIAATGIPSIVIPFSALDGAGIDLDSIVPLDVTPDAEWSETVERRTLAELPRWRRTYSDTVARESTSVDRIPERYRYEWRNPTADEVTAGSPAYYSRLAVAPDADGRYRWNEHIERTVQPDADGVYRYTESRHRLGGALFTAERLIVEPSRPAAPFEANVTSRRLIVTLTDTDRRAYCDGEDTSGVHESGAAGSCIYCASPLTATVSYRRRARYLSSFDYNEPVPLYFLCEVPRTGAPTVAGAIDSLAPRAVHAAILDGREVRRQGDIFFIDTALTTATLAERGAIFGRHTLWTRGARPRAGEVTYRAPDRAQDTALAARERKYARRLWREQWRAMQARAHTAYLPDADARERSRERWNELRLRHAGYRLAADTAGVAYDAPYSVICDVCGAGTGVPCYRLPDSVGAPLAGRLCGCSDSRYRHSLADAIDRERRELSRETARERKVPPAPHTSKGSRARWRELRHNHAGEVTAARFALRRATLAVPRIGRNGYIAGVGGPGYAESATAYRRRAYLAGVVAARHRLDVLTAHGAVDSHGNTGRAHGRDMYRARFGTNAIAVWSRALHEARLRYRPETIADADAAPRNREAVRAHLSIYGTAHTATDVARVGGAVYVRGTVRHAVDLDAGRRGLPDHRPVVLCAGRWYLAVRNTVPRQNRRRRRLARPPLAGNNG